MKWSLLFKKDNIKLLLSILSFVCSIIIGFWAMIIPPAGVIDLSILIFIAQLLLFTSSILGINVDFSGFGKTFKNKHREEEYDRDC